MSEETTRNGALLLDLTYDRLEDVLNGYPDLVRGTVGLKYSSRLLQYSAYAIAREMPRSNITELMLIVGRLDTLGDYYQDKADLPNANPEFWHILQRN